MVKAQEKRSSLRRFRARAKHDGNKYEKLGGHNKYEKHGGHSGFQVALKMGPIFRAPFFVPIVGGTHYLLGFRYNRTASFVDIFPPTMKNWGISLAIQEMSAGSEIRV